MHSWASASQGPTQKGIDEDANKVNAMLDATDHFLIGKVA